MRVTPKLFDGIAKPVKRLFDIRAPVFVIQAVFETLPFPGILQGMTGRRENKLFLLVEGIQEGEIFSFEFIPKDIAGIKKAEEAFRIFRSGVSPPPEIIQCMWTW